MSETKTAHTPLHMPSTPTGIDRSSAAYECGCTSTLGAIDLCRLHRAAPELLKALEAIATEPLDLNELFPHIQAIERMKKRAKSALDAAGRG